MKLIISDLDRTLLPNGHDEYDDSLPKLFQILEKVLDKKLVYATGRNLDMMMDAVNEYGIHLPDYLVAEVGSKIYKKEIINSDIEMKEDLSWKDYVLETAGNWNREKVEKILSSDVAELQEDWKNNDLKVSFYIKNLDKPEELIKNLEKDLENAQINAKVLWSVDPLENIGLLDILPERATKLEAVEFLRKKYDVSKEETYYFGDSGNDILALTNGYNSVLVKNANSETKSEVLKINKERGHDNFYIAKGEGDLNGNYSSGIIEGLSYFNLI